MNENNPFVFVIDDDSSIRESLRNLIRSTGLNVQTFVSAQEFLAGRRPEAPGCLVLDVELPGLSGLDLQRRDRRTSQDQRSRGGGRDVRVRDSRNDRPQAVPCLWRRAARSRQVLPSLRCQSEQPGSPITYWLERTGYGRMGKGL